MSYVGLPKSKGIGNRDRNPCATSISTLLGLHCFIKVIFDVWVDLPIAFIHLTIKL